MLTREGEALECRLEDLKTSSGIRRWEGGMGRRVEKRRSGRRGRGFKKRQTLKRLPYWTALDGQNGEQTIVCFPLWDESPSPECASGNHEGLISRLGQAVGGTHTMDLNGENQDPILLLPGKWSHGMHMAWLTSKSCQWRNISMLDDTLAQGYGPHTQSVHCRTPSHPHGA